MHNFTLKELLNQINYFKKRHPDVPDDKINIYIERIKDVYFEKHGWTTKDRIQNDATPDDKLEPEALERRHAAGIKYSDYDYITQMIPAFTGVIFQPNEDGTVDLMITPHY